MPHSGARFDFPHSLRALASPGAPALLPYVSNLVRSKTQLVTKSKIVFIRWPPVAKKLANGADLMLPGVVVDKEQGLKAYNLNGRKLQKVCVSSG